MFKTRWYLRPRTARERTQAALSPTDDMPADVVHHGAGAWPASVRDVPDDLAAGRDWSQTRLTLEVDDGLTVPVALNDQNASRILEATERLREYREREKAAVPPVYNFGADSSWGAAGE